MTTVSQPGVYCGMRNKHQTEQFTSDDPNEKIRLEASGHISTHPMNLTQAAEYNDVANTKKMLMGDFGALGSLDVTLSFCSGPALYTAAYYGSFDIVKLLVDAGAGVNVVGKQQGSPLLVAALGGHIKTIKFLLEHPDIDVNLADPNNTTPLAIAAEFGHLEVVRCLLKVETINIHTRNTFDGKKPIDYARLSSHSEMISLIESHNTFHQLTTHWTSTSINNAYDKDGRTALFTFCRFGDAEQVEKLLNIKGIEPNKSFYETNHGYWTTPLATAANHDHIKCVQLLLTHPNIDANDGGKNNVSVVHDTILNGNIAMLSLFLQHPDFNVHSTVGIAQKMPLIVFSLSKKQTTCFKQIMEHPNIDINACDTIGSSALLVAGLTSNTEAIDILLAHPDINVHTHTSYSRTKFIHLW